MKNKIILTLMAMTAWGAMAQKPVIKDIFTADPALACSQPAGATGVPSVLITWITMKMEP